MLNMKIVLEKGIVFLFCVILFCGKKEDNAYMKSINKDEIKTFSLTNNNQCSVTITNFGATVMSIKVPDKSGTIGDVVLGYDTPQEYIDGNPYFGATIGRYANRICKGKFSLNGKEYTLPINNGNNHLHGGPQGFHNVIWKVEDYSNKNDQHFVKLGYVSKDGEQGYPGLVSVTVKYSLTDKNELIIDYSAVTDEKTIINLTHHSFFNLKDGGKSTILNHKLKILADKYTPVNSELIPTGEIKTVHGTHMDFTGCTEIGERINNDFIQLKYGNGYDHNWVLTKKGDSLALAAVVYEPETGRRVEVFTTEPGLQFYSGNFLDGSDIGKGGVSYKYRTAFCLESQHFPDSPNHKDFPSTVLLPGECYKQRTIYKFSVEE